MIHINQDFRIKPNHRSWVVEQRRVTQKGEEVWEAKAHCVRLQGAIATLLDKSQFDQAKKEELQGFSQLLEPGKINQALEGIHQLRSYTARGVEEAWLDLEVEFEGSVKSLQQLTPNQLLKIRIDLKDDQEVVQVLNAWDALQCWSLE